MKTARDFLHLGGYALEVSAAKRYYMGGDPPPAQSSTSTVQQYSPEEAEQRAALMAAAKGIYNSQQGQWNSMINPAARPVAASANTLQGQEMERSAALGPGTAAANSASGALNYGLSGRGGQADAATTNALNYGMSGNSMSPGAIPGLSSAMQRGMSGQAGELSNIPGLAPALNRGLSGQAGQTENVRGLTGAMDFGTSGAVLNPNVVPGMGKALDYGLSGKALDPSNTPGYDSALQAALRPVDQAYQDPGGVLSQIRGNFTAGNSGGSGTREGIAGGLAARSYLDTVGDVSGKMAQDQYGKGLNFMASAMNTGVQQEGQGLNYIQGMSGIGTGLYGKGLDYGANLANTGANVYGQGVDFAKAGMNAGLTQQNQGLDFMQGMTSNALTNKNQGLDLMKSSMAFAPNMYNLMMQPGASVGAVGSQQEAYQQAQENAAGGDRAWALQAPWAGLQPYANAVQGFSNPSTVTTGTAPVAQKNAMAPIGGAMMGASTAAMMGINPVLGGAAGLIFSLMNS